MDRVRQMFQSHPAPTSDAGEEAYALIQAAEECAAHAAHMEHCRVCAEACRACATACAEMKDPLVA